MIKDRSLSIIEISYYCRRYDIFNKKVYNILQLYFFAKTL